MKIRIEWDEDSQLYSVEYKIYLTWKFYKSAQTYEEAEKIIKEISECQTSG